MENKQERAKLRHDNEFWKTLTVTDQEIELFKSSIRISIQDYKEEIKKPFYTNEEKRQLADMAKILESLLKRLTDQYPNYVTAYNVDSRVKE